MIKHTQLPKGSQTCYHRHVTNCRPRAGPFGTLEHTVPHCSLRRLMLLQREDTGLQGHWGQASAAWSLGALHSTQSALSATIWQGGQQVTGLQSNGPRTPNMPGRITMPVPLTTNPQHKEPCVHKVEKRAQRGTQPERIG